MKLLNNLCGCDTLVALKDATLEGNIIFGKNSDRPDDEAQNLVHIPRKSYSKNDTLKCTYIEIQQVKETYEMLICQPSWMWGAEMGVNEWGVCIGNEAVWTIEPYSSSGLLGMDLLRLGLERGKLAKESMMIIIDLLEKYGQGGACSEDGAMNYHNSFLISDSKEAWVLETSGKWWVAEQIQKGFRAISNSLSIRGKGTIRCEGIIDYAISNNLIKDEKNFDFAQNFSQGYVPEKPSPFSRDGRSMQLLRQNYGKITEKMMMNFLRDHKAGLCMHGGFTSTASQVSKIPEDNNSINWFTNASNPCLNFYKPYIFPHNGKYTIKSGPFSSVNAEWNWVKFDKFKSKINKMNKENKLKYYNEINQIEDELINEINELKNKYLSSNKEFYINSAHQISEKSWDMMKKIYNSF